MESSWPGPDTDEGIANAQGLQRLSQADIFPHNFISQKFQKEPVDEDEEWAGARLQGVTEIGFGPDANKFITTLHCADILGDENHFVAVCVGVFDTQMDAESRMVEFFRVLGLLGSDHTKTTDPKRVVEDNYMYDYHEHIKCYRSKEQLRLTVKPCSGPGCSKIWASKFCSACKATMYCSFECQKADWQCHKRHCSKLCKEQERIKEKRKEERKEYREMLADAWRVTREPTNGATDLALQASAREKLRNIQDANCTSRIDSLRFFGADDSWDAGVEVGLLPVLRDIISADLETVKLLGPGVLDLLVFRTPSTSTRCVAFRCMQLFVETDGIFPAYIKLLQSFTELFKRALQQEDESNNRCHTLKMGNRVFSFMHHVMSHPEVGASVVRAHWQNPDTPVLFRLVFEEVLKFPRSRSTWEGGLRSLALQLPAMFQIWAVRLSLSSDAEAMEFKDALGLAILDLYHYETEAMAVAEMIILRNRRRVLEVILKEKMDAVGTYRDFVRKTVERKRGIP